MTTSTTKQRVSRYVKKYQGHTVSEIARSLGLSLSAVNEAVNALKYDIVIYSTGAVKKEGQRFYPVGATVDFAEKHGISPMMGLFNRGVMSARNKQNGGAA